LPTDPLYNFTPNRDCTIRTFNAFASELLKQFASEIQLSPDFQTVSRAEESVYLLHHLDKLELSRYAPHNGQPTALVKQLLDLFSRLRAAGVTVEKYTEWVTRQRQTSNAPVDIDQDDLASHSELSRAFHIYQGLKLADNIMNFDDQMFYATQLLTKCPRLVATAFPIRYVHVDEYQDMNPALLAFLTALMAALGHTNLMCVGDANQSIFSFRSSTALHFEQFLRTFPSAPVLTSKCSFRSNADILKGASQLIMNNASAKPTNLVRNSVTQSNILDQLHDNTGPCIQHLDAETSMQEQSMIIASIEQQIKSSAGSARPLQYRDIAILVRHNADAIELQAALSAANIPSRTLGLNRLFQRPEIRLLTSLLSALVTPSESRHLYALLGSPLVYCFSSQEMALLMEHAALHNGNLQSAVGTLATSQTTVSAALPASEVLESLRQRCRTVHTHLTAGASALAATGVRAVVLDWLKATGWAERLLTGRTWDDVLQSRNISKFLGVLEDCERQARTDHAVYVIPYLNDMMLFAEDMPASDGDDDDAEANDVQIMSIHRSKGLEFEIAYLYRCVDHKMPGVNRQPTLRVPTELIPVTSGAVC
jgi:DNA helicase-2/ATP-dependent DNA helicase PcrA